jgi:Zn-finger nucleic acid-binding protein
VFELPHPVKQAGSLACPSCGANVNPTSHTCEFCTAALLVKACPRCFAKIFHGSKHCRQCGAKIDVAAVANPDGTAHQRECPRCEDEQQLVARLVGDTLLDECPGCHGVWLDSAAVERIVQERRQASAHAVMGIAKPDRMVKDEPARGKLYVKCPDCDTVMNRINFGRRSGIIVDVCRSHGTWFDAEELPRIVEFVMKGGLEDSERRDAEALRQDARRIASNARREVRTSGMMRRVSGSRDVEMFGGLLGAIGGAMFRG